MGIKAVQLTSKYHHENIMACLFDLRLQGKLCDVMVQVDHEGDEQEFQAHQVILAASSGYFRKILLDQKTSQNKLLVSNIQSNDFSKFLEFIYTGKIEVSRNRINDVEAMANFLECEALSEVCGQALSAGVLQDLGGKASIPEVDVLKDLHVKVDKKTEGEKQVKNVLPKRQLSPQVQETSEVKKRCRARRTQINEKKTGSKSKLRPRSNKITLSSLKEAVHIENQHDTEGDEATEDETQSQEKDKESTLGTSSDYEAWESEDDLRHIDSQYPLFPMEEETEAEEGLSKGKLNRTSKAEFECKKCQRTFFYEKSYLKHISTYHGVKADVVYRCDTCKQTFANRSNLKTHEKHVHSTERLFSCSICLKTFKRKKDVVRHQKQVHEQNVRPICPECGKILSSKGSLLLHERTHTGTKPYKCSNCEARFTQKSALNMHMRTHTGEKPYACDECDSRFSQKHMLSYHKRSHTGEKPFMCEACGKNFASKEYLRHHSNIHTGNKPYKCEHCGRCFAQRNSLNQHIKVHTGERPYSCKDCDKQFTQLNALQRHHRIHTGEKPYMCGLCSRTFTDKSTLRRHTTTHDSNAPWKNYLVVLEGNVEAKKTNSLYKEKNEKAESGEKKSKRAKAPNYVATSPGSPSAATGSPTDPDETDVQPIVVSSEPVGLSSDWTTHGAIALVSHCGLGGITVIHTEVAPDAQIQPVATANDTGTNVISLDGAAIPVPFSIPVSVSHNVSLSSEAPGTSLSVPTVSVPVSDVLLASVSDITTVPTSSVLEAAASQTILASVSENKALSDTDILPPDVRAIMVGDACTDKLTDVHLEGQESSANDFREKRATVRSDHDGCKE